MPGPLSGITVIEVANFISGPFAAMLLGDLGAEVIKVEMPETGDPFRHWVELKGKHRPQFAAYNHGKRSITANLKSDGGREVVRRLARTADVLIENFRPGTLDALGLGYDDLRELNPRLIYCSITGMGPSGPEAEKPTYDATAQAVSGLTSLITDPSDPQVVGPPFSDQLTGLFAAQAILAALVRRGDHGTGQKLETSMLASTIAFLAEPIADYLETGRVATPRARGQRSQSYAFVASDGLPIAVHLSTPPKFWRGLATAIGMPELIEDERFATKYARIKHYDDLKAIVAERIRTRPRAEWLALFEQHDVPAAPINTVAEAIESPQAQHLSLVWTHGEGDRAVRLVRPPVDFSETPNAPGGPPPLLSEHTDEILQRLGYSAEDLAQLRAAGAI